MKKFYYSLFAAASMMLAVTSCSQEEEIASQSSNVTRFSIQLEGATQSRTAGDGQTVDKLYYAVYDNNTNNVIYPANENYGTAEKVNGGWTLELPLMKSETYDILFWAQKDGSNAYAFENLTNIEVNYPTNGTLLSNKEDRDAFFNALDNFTASGSEHTIVLRRPFAQLNIATTMEDWNKAKAIYNSNNGTTDVAPVSASAVTVSSLAKNFNVMTGEATNVTEGAVTFGANSLNDLDEKIEINGVEYKPLAMNYLLPVGQKQPNGISTYQPTGAEDKDMVEVVFTLYKGQNAEIVNVTVPATPIQHNWRTNIIGNLLTGEDFEIIVDSEFDNEENKDIEIYAEGIVKDAEGKYHITTEGGLWAFANMVNNGSTPEEGRAATDYTFKGETFYLDCDVDLEDQAWTPIVNFAGTFDGQNKTISNLKVAVEGKASAGLFANSKGYIKNIVVDGATIEGNYKAGVIMGDGLCARIENCHVKDANVTITPLDKDDANHAGGIVGYLSGEPEAFVKNCKVENSRITAYRDAGGIVGTANQAAEVTGNEVSNVTVIANQTAEYNEAKPANVDAIAGRRSEKATIENNNTIGNNVVYVLVNTAENAQFQAENATGDFLIKFGEDIEGDVMIQQKKDVNITIDGMNWKYDGTIKIHNGSSNNNATLLIKNVRFETSVKERNFIMPNDFGIENGVTRRYSQNVTVDGCTFTATGDAKNTAVGVQAKSSTNLQVLNCTATDMHSLLQAQSCLGDVIVYKASINGKNGVAFKQVKNAVVEASTIEAAEYGIRFDGNTDNYGITVKDNDVTANQPFIVRKMTGANNTIALEGNNTLTAGESFQIVITNGSDDEKYVKPTGTYTLAGADEFNVYPRDAADYAQVYTVEELNAALADGDILTIELGAGEFGTIVAKSNKTIIGSANAKVNAVNLNGAENLTLKGINFDAAKAVMSYGGDGQERYFATIFSRDASNATTVNGAKNLIIEDCTFEGTFPGGGGAVTCFADQTKTGSHNVTIKGCTFNVQNCGYAIYGFYFGNDQYNFVIEGNTFKTATYANTIYLGRYMSSIPVEVKDNIFEVTTKQKAMYIQDHGYPESHYGASINASGNTFANK